MARVNVPVTSITPVKASLTTALAGTNNDLVYTAKVGGPAGNQIRVAYLVSGTTALSVAIQGWDIVVTVGTTAGTPFSTAAQITTAVNAVASHLVTIANAASNDGSGIVAALSITALAGGALQQTQPSQTNSDSTNGHYLTGNDGNVFLEVFNNNAASKTVSILYSPIYAPIATVAAQVETIPNATTRIIGPFANGAFDQNSTRDVYFDVNVTTDIKFRAYKVVKAL